VVGGIGLHAHEISRWQASLGHEVTVYTSKVDDSPMEEFRDGYRIVRFKPVIKLMGNSFMPGLLLRLMHDKEGFDVIHAHSHLFLSTNWCALRKKFGSPPLIITNHGLYSQTAPSYLQKVYIPTVAKWTLNTADRIICYTDKEAAQLRELGIPSAKIRVIHNGIDTGVFVPPKNKDIRPDYQLLWIGRFVPGKGVKCLIDAFNILVKGNEEYKLTMVGEGPLKGEIRQKVDELGLVKHIRFIDFIPNSELPKLYQGSTIFVLTSINEGVPRTILEAMACGVPVVATRLPQLVPILEDAGMVVPPGDPRAVADAILEITTNKDLLQRLGENARMKVVSKYSWADTVGKTLELYEEAIGEYKHRQKHMPQF